jgi:hypothetical protein
MSTSIIHRFDHDTPIEETLKLTLDRLCNDEAEIMAKPVFEPLPPMSDRIGVAKHRLHPDLAARADFDGTSRLVVCPKVKGAAARQVEPRMMPVASQDAVLDAATLQEGSPYADSDCQARRRGHPRT